MRGSLAADRGPKKLGWGSSAESRGRSTAWFARVSAAPEAEPDSGYLLTKLQRGCIGTISRQPDSSKAAWASASYTGRTAG